VGGGTRPRTPSPNAGQVEAAFAGALEIRLGGRVRYAHGVEDRPVLGDGRTPDAGHVTRAVELSRLVGAVSCVMAAILAALMGQSAGSSLAARVLLLPRSSRRQPADHELSAVHWLFRHERRARPSGCQRATGLDLAPREIAEAADRHHARTRSHCNAYDRNGPESILRQRQSRSARRAGCPRA